MKDSIYESYGFGCHCRNCQFRVAKKSDENSCKKGVLATNMITDKSFCSEGLPEYATVEPEWIYETGRDEPNVLDSGTSLYNVFKSYDAEKVFERQEIDGGNYIRRYHKIDGRVEDVQYWNKFTHKWMN